MVANFGFYEIITAGMIDKVTNASKRGELLYIMSEIVKIFVDLGPVHTECTPVAECALLFYKALSNL
jgi:hypothetical protein